MPAHHLRRPAATAARAGSRALSGEAVPSTVEPVSVKIWGNGNSGELGLGPVTKEGTVFPEFNVLSPVPFELPGGQTVTDIAFGLNHSLFVSADGKVFACGDREYGKLGLGDNTDKSAFVETPEEVTGFDAPIKAVAAGESHSAALDVEGRVYTWGYGGSWFGGGGILGQGSNDTLTSPKLVQSLVDEKVVIESVKCGELHTAVLSNAGEVFTTGVGEFGRLGTGGSYDVSTFEMLDYLAEDDIVQLESGHAFNLALTSDGKVYCWGRNDQGQLGQGGTLSLDVYSMESDPKIIEHLADFNIKNISTGHSHAAAVTADGELFMWGMKDFLEPKKIAVVPMPGQADANEGEGPVKVVAAACGMNFTAVLSDKGRLYTFGLGRSSCLGHGDRAFKSEPVLVEALGGEVVTRVVAGHRRIAAFAK